MPKVPIDAHLPESYIQSLAQVPARQGESEKDRERRERLNRVNAYLLDLARTGKVNHRAIYGGGPHASLDSADSLADLPSDSPATETITTKTCEMAEAGESGGKAGGGF